MRKPRAPKTLLTLRPGDKGVQGLQQKYGKRLLTVRYRYDAKTMRRYTTVELVEEIVPWRRRPGVKPNSMVAIRTGYDEDDVRDIIRKAGGRWKREWRAWLLDYASVLKLGLRDRIVDPHVDP